jgi:hypothetical protein
MNPGRETRLALISAILITTISVGLFYLIFDKLVDFGFLTKPLALISLLSYPGMLPGFVIAGSVEGNFHSGGKDPGLIFCVAIALDLIFYFVVTSILLRAWAKLRGRT